MADISTTYMGVELSSPVLVGAGTFSRKIDNFKIAEDAGAGAMVVYSLFQEQIELERQELEEALAIGSEHFPESLTYFPHLEHSGPREHIMWVEKARKAVKMPIIGSLNATSAGSWIEYAKLLENAGCNALELNTYSVETDLNMTGGDIENRILDIIVSVKSDVKVPVAVKISPWFTSVANFVHKIADAGADGVVLFNRFYQPMIDTDTQSLKIDLDLSRPQDVRLSSRWIALLSGKIDVDFAASTGIHSGKDAVRQILAGAKVAQAVSVLYKNGLSYITDMNREISDWMDAKGYKTIEDFRGRLNQKHVSDPYAFERAQYVRLLMGYND